MIPPTPPVPGPQAQATRVPSCVLVGKQLVNFALYGQPEFNQADVFIGPDGRISFLQAQDIMAAGLTVDELRAKFDEALSKYYRTPRTIITPTNFRSKKYYVLGKVVNRGVFTLERPLTIVEAVARAKGAPLGDHRTIEVELDDPRPPLIDNVKKIVGTNPHIPRTVKTGRRTFPRRDECSVGR